MIVISTVGRAGSMLLQSLFDEHPSVVVFPEVAQSYNYFKVFKELDYDIERWLVTRPQFYNGFDPFNENFNNQIDKFFNHNKAEFIEVFNNIAKKSGGVKNFSSKKFITALAISLAYIYKQDITKLNFVVFHHHNNRKISIEAPLILQDFSHVKVLVAIRHPIENALSFQTLESRTGIPTFRKFSRNIRGWSVRSLRNLTTLSQQLPDNCFRLLDLNALHRNPEDMLSKLIIWIGIENYIPLMTPSISGIPWLGNSANGEPIKAFEEKRAKLIYPYTIDTEKGLKRFEYQYAQYFCNDAMIKLGYSNNVKIKPINLFIFLVIAFKNIDFFDEAVIPHDKGWRKFVRKFGYSEILLVIKELILIRYAPIPYLKEFRIDEK